MGKRKRDKNSGKFIEEYPHDDFLLALEELGPSGTTKIADIVGCDRRTAYLKLQTLEEDGKVRSQEVGRSLLWELNDET